MPYRTTLFITGEIYHIFNRSIAKQPIYRFNNEYERMCDLIDYYRFFKPPFRYSHYNRLSLPIKQQVSHTLVESGEPLMEILCFCLMSNHFHFILRQTKNNGISAFMSNIQNGYAKFMNLKQKRTGSLFQSMFKSVRIQDDEQLLHVGRYIHLNPLTSYIVSSPDELTSYPWSSFGTYLGRGGYKFVSTDLMLNLLKDGDGLRSFTYDQLDYQRALETIKHLTFENPSVSS